MLEAIRDWSEQNIEDVLKARDEYDCRSAPEATDE